MEMDKYDFSSLNESKINKKKRIELPVLKKGGVGYDTQLKIRKRKKITKITVTKQPSLSPDDNISREDSILTRTTRNKIDTQD